MLINFNNRLFSVLKVLDSTCTNFHLTGSRFFGGYTKDSDYDFLVDEKEISIKLLHDLGFNKSFEYVTDVKLTCTLSYGNIIHIIVVPDLVKRLIVQEKLKRSGLMVILKKPERKKLWNLALEEFDVRVAQFPN